MNKQIKSFTLDEEIIKFFEKLAKKEERSVSWILNDILTKKMEKLKNE